MERIVYRKTLDVHKNGVQFLLQGFETADILSRVIEISLMASGDAIDFPLERIEAMMYVTTPNATEPSINKCTIKDNKVIYDVLPIKEEGITEMQLKLIETSPDGAKSVLATPKFSVDVTKSNADDESAEQTTTFTALEDAMAKAKTVYDERFLRMELDSECIFKAYYADGSVYETDILQKLFLNGNALLSESYAHGGTGVRTGEDTDNAKYYSNVSRSEALNAKSIMEDSEDILEEVRLHGVYTAFSVDFESGEVEYISPSFKFNLNLETGELDAKGQTYTFDEEIGRIVTEWLGNKGVILSDLQAISSIHTEDIKELKERVTPVVKGGTGAKNVEDARTNLSLYSKDEVCDDVTKSLFGVSSDTPPTYFLKMLATHWWKRRTTESRWDIRVVEQACRMSGYYENFQGGRQCSIYYSDEITVTENGIALVNAQTFHEDFSRLDAPYYHPADFLKGKYFANRTWNKGTFSDPLFDEVYKANDDEIIFVYQYGDIYIENTTKFTNHFYENKGEAEFLQSSNKDTYPTGTVDGWEYEYIGVPFQNAREGAKIQIGTYVGTGVSGAENQNYLTFDFEPKLLFISSSYEIRPNSGTISFYNYIGFFVKGDGCYHYIKTNDDSSGSGTCGFNGNTITWYNHYDEYQLNCSQVNYHFVAIG